MEACILVSALPPVMQGATSTSPIAAAHPAIGNLLICTVNQPSTASSPSVVPGSGAVVTSFSLGRRAAWRIALIRELLPAFC